MSKRAEEAALKAYPIKDYRKEPNYVHTCDTKMLVKVYRKVFKLGYMQAEKDLALTVEDIERIHVFLYAVKNNKQGCFTFTRLKDEQYQEVLDKFNKAKDYDTEQNTH